MIGITMNTKSLDTEEESYCRQEPFKTITVTSFIKEKYEIKFQYFIDLVDVKKEIQRQAKETRKEHLSLDLIILVHKNPGASHKLCRQNHTFLKNEQLFMFVRFSSSHPIIQKDDHRSPGFSKDVSCE